MGPKELTCRQHKVSMRLPLDDDPDVLFQGFKAKLRSQIRRPRKAGAKSSGRQRIQRRRKGHRRFLQGLCRKHA